MLTARQIALRIQDPGEDLRVIGERLRTWTKEGLLKPIGKRNPGTGRYLRYPKRAVVDAAILSKLHRHFGIWAPRLQYCASALDLAVKHISDFHLYDGTLIYLTIGVLYKDENASLPTELFSELQYVNINNARKGAAPNPSLRVPKAFRPHRLIGLPELLEFGIVINLTSLYRRLAFPSAEAEKAEKFYQRFPDARRIVNAGFFSSMDLENNEDG
jgi:hypothetical protein